MSGPHAYWSGVLGEARMAEPLPPLDSRVRRLALSIVSDLEVVRRELPMLLRSARGHHLEHNVRTAMKLLDSASANLREGIPERQPARRGKYSTTAPSAGY